MERNGFTLVEMTVALVILAVGILGIAATAGRLGTVSSSAEIEALALQAVNDRIALVRLHPGYGGLDTLYTETDSDLPLGDHVYARTTKISRIVEEGQNDKKLDYTRITVSVEGPMLRRPVSRSLTVGAP